MTAAGVVPIALRPKREAGAAPQPVRSGVRGGRQRGVRDRGSDGEGDLERVSERERDRV